MRIKLNSVLAQASAWSLLKNWWWSILSFFRDTPPPIANSVVFLLPRWAELRPLASHPPCCCDGQGQPRALFLVGMHLVPAKSPVGSTEGPLPEAQRHWRQEVPQAQWLLSFLEIPVEERVPSLQGPSLKLVTIQQGRPGLGQQSDECPSVPMSPVPMARTF